MAALALAAALSCAAAACDDGSADPGAACVEADGVCSGSDVVCGASLPYPCPGTETCCIPLSKPAPAHDAGGQ